MRVRESVAGTLVAASMLLTGCSTPDAGVGPRQPSPTTLPSAQLRTDTSPAALASQKKSAGIVDCPASDRRTAAVATGLPDLELRCLGGGRPVRLAGLRGRPMLVNIWAQWCGPCRTEAPFLAEVARGDITQLRVLGVDYADPLPDRAIEFARVAGWRYAQLVDPDRAITAPLRISGVPQTFFVAADGTIAYRHSGPFTSAGQIRRLVAEHLGVTL